MRKGTKQNRKKIAASVPARMAAEEFTEIMLKARLHLEMIRSTDNSDPYYLASIVGVMNVATALSYMHRDTRSFRFYESVQPIILKIASDGIGNTDLGARLTKVFNAAERYIEVNSKTDILKAINLVRFQIEQRGQGTVLPLRENYS